MSTIPSLQLRDVTNREGVQAAGVHVSRFGRTMLNRMLAASGVAMAEIGFPTLSHERPYMEANMALARRGGLSGMRLSGWCRATRDDVEAARENCPELDGLNLSVPVSDGLIEAKFGGRRGWPAVLHIALDAVRAARLAGIGTITLGLEDSSRAPESRLAECGVEAARAGVDALRYGDTLGLDQPHRIRRRARALAAGSGLAVGVHVHNDLGMAVASSLAGALGVIEAGMDAIIDVTVNGIGERAGNADFFTTLLALDHGLMDEGEPVFHTARIDPAGIAMASRYLAIETGLPIPPRAPGLGRDVFSHSSGIHVDGILKSLDSYEPFHPDFFERADGPISGTPQRQITLGPYSGLHALRHVYGGMGIDFGSDDEARGILDLVQRAAAQVKRSLTADELLFIHSEPGIASMLVLDSLSSSSFSLSPQCR